MPHELTPEETVRYGRHLILPEIGLQGQLKLKSARILLVGAGGLGSPAALYLAAAGVGVLGIVDSDTVDLSNLHRQVIHGTPDVGRSKLDSAAETLSAINPNAQVIKHEGLLTSKNALSIISGYDLVVDGTDNFPTRYLVNDSCVLLGKLNVYGSIFKFDGQASVFCAPQGPCYRCLYPEPPPPGLVPSCAEGGVLGILPGIIGLIQSTEAIKLILGIGEPLVGRLLLYDALAMGFTEVRIKRDPACPICGANPTIDKLIDYEEFCGMPKQTKDTEIDASELVSMMKQDTHFVLIDVREPHEFATSRIPGAKLIPLGELQDRVNELDPKAFTVMQCHSGMRSARACEFLRSAGFEHVVNLRGGILAWEKASS